jgi:hypothetical protein
MIHWTIAMAQGFTLLILARGIFDKRIIVM